MVPVFLAVLVVICLPVTLPVFLDMLVLSWTEKSERLREVKQPAIFLHSPGGGS